MTTPYPAKPPEEPQPWTFTVHTTYVDGSQSWDLFDTKEDANAHLQGVLADPEVDQWVAYQVVQMGTGAR